MRYRTSADPINPVPPVTKIFLPSVLSCDTNSASVIRSRAQLLLFYFLIPLPPTFTLFPYTTLFRSHEILGARDPDPEAVLPRLWHQRRRVAPQHRDRKSTRLNSSHVEISYAVFCLQKKNDPCDR